MRISRTILPGEKGFNPDRLQADKHMSVINGKLIKIPGKKDYSGIEWDKNYLKLYEDCEKIPSEKYLKALTIFTLISGLICLSLTFYAIIK